MGIDHVRITVKEIGAIVEVHGPVVLIRCDPLPSLQQALVIRDKFPAYTFEVYQHIDREHIRAITLENPAGLQRGIRGYDSGAPLSVPVSQACLGRPLDSFGAPLDGGTPAR